MLDKPDNDYSEYTGGFDNYDPLTIIPIYKKIINLGMQSDDN